jgi:CBS domain containing-hemolysin-like protein
MPKSSIIEESSKPDNQKLIKKDKKNNELSFFNFRIFRTLNNIFSKFFLKNTSEFDEILERIKITRKNMSSEEKEIFNNFLKFGSKNVEDIMVPRSDIIAVSADASLSEVNEVIFKYSHTRILVFEDNLDNIIGFLHIKDLYNNLAKKKNFVISKLIRKPIISTTSMKITDLFNQMQKERIHISVVVDEYGCTDGIVTRKNILKEIFGEIDDEHEREHLADSYQIINDNTIIANARVEVEDLEKVLRVKLKSAEDDFDTIGGLVMAKAGNLPPPGTIISISDQVEIEVLEASPRSLKKVKIYLKN